MNDGGWLARNAMRLVAWAQGAYDVITGVWPLLSMETFLRVTGPKTDLWLVDTVGVLVLVIGAALIVAGIRNRFGPEIVLLAIASALGLMLIDVVFWATRTIPAVYLLDACLELGLVGCWSWAALQGRAPADLRP